MLLDWGFRINGPRDAANGTDATSLKHQLKLTVNQKRKDTIKMTVKIAQCKLVQKE